MPRARRPSALTCATADDLRNDELPKNAEQPTENMGEPMAARAGVAVLIAGVPVPYAAAALVAGVFREIIVAVSGAAASKAGAHGEDIRDPHNAFPLSSRWSSHASHQDRSDLGKFVRSRLIPQPIQSVARLLSGDRCTPADEFATRCLNRRRPQASSSVFANSAPYHSRRM